MPVEGNQQPVFDGENTAVLYLTQEGPVKIDLSTGQKLWVSDKLKGKEPPAPRNGYAPIVKGENVVFVPYGKSLQALDAKFKLTAQANPEIAMNWLPLMVRADGKEAIPAIEAYLTTIGRRRNLGPLYKALIEKGGSWLELARATFVSVASSPVARIALRCASPHASRTWAISSKTWR